MILVFGGAYQGKREFAEKLFAEFKKDGNAAAVYDCAAREGSAPAPAEPDFSADIICGLEQFVWTCCADDPKERVEAADWMKERQPLWKDKILVITDVSQGIVPMDARTRAFREMNGRMMMYLAREADEVWRVFCGIGKQIR